MTRRRSPSAVADTLWIVAGCLCVALGFRLFLNGNHLVTGGVVGLSTLLEHALRIDPAWTQWAINIPLLLLAFKVLGPAGGLRSLLGSLLLPLCVLLLRPLPPLTGNLVLASVFGGALYGLGIGMIFWGSGSVGGFTVVAQILARVTPVKRSAALLAMDAAVLLAGASVFGTERALYGLLASFAMRRTIDGVLSGFGDARVAWIITGRHETVRAMVLKELDRGLTVLPGEGGLSGEARPVLMAVLSQSEVPRLRERVRAIDPDAFLFVTDAAEVLGKGFHNPS